MDKTIIDLIIPVTGNTLPSNHGYALMSALSNTIPTIHNNRNIRISSINGIPRRQGEIQITATSHFRIRLPLEDTPTIIHKLSQKTLEINNHPIQLQIPSVAPLEPAPTLKAWLVTIKFSIEPEVFMQSAKSQLRKLNIAGDIHIPEKNGALARKIIKVKDTKFVGYSTIVSNLSEQDSILLQQMGLGGRQRMGCGFFLPHQASPTAPHNDTNTTNTRIMELAR